MRKRARYHFWAIVSTPGGNDVSAEFGGLLTAIAPASNPSARLVTGGIMHSRASAVENPDLSGMAEQMPQMATSSVSSHAIRVLIADDNRDSADTLAILLQYRGCEVRTVYDGEEALKAFAEQPADLVLLDLGMPRLGGHDTCRALRSMNGGRDALVVAVTGWGQARDRERSHEAGFDEHVVKPVDHETLSMLLQKPSGRQRDHG